MLLEETLSRYPVGHADHGERAIRQMRQDEGRDLGKVAQQVALGKRRLPERWIRGPVDAGEGGEGGTRGKLARRVAFGNRRLPERWIRGPVDAVEVREANLVRTNCDRECG